MPGMAVREFECSLCRQQFTLLSGDLILPEPNICDDCLRVVWELESEALMEHVVERLGLPNEGQSFVNNVVQHIKRLKGQWGTADDLIRLREQERGTFSQSTAFFS